MRAIIQRVDSAEVTIDYTSKKNISKGLLVYICVELEDSLVEMQWMSKKIVNLRIFDDEVGNFNYSVKDVQGEILIVSNFTLVADITKGNRPSFNVGITPQDAKEKYLIFLNCISTYNISVQTGEFGAHMDINALVNGPVNIIIDTSDKFSN